VLNKKLLWVLAILVCGVALMAAYNRPYRWWPFNDMTEQPILKPFNKDGLRQPPEGAVKVDAWDPVPLKTELANYPDFKNPLASSPESIKRGEALYSIYCWTCHGEGFSPDPAKYSPIKRGKLNPDDPEVRWSMPAADINLISLYSDEHIYSVITHGSAIMKRMSYHLSPEERWHVVNYVRSLITEHQSQSQ